MIDEIKESEEYKKLEAFHRLLIADSAAYKSLRELLNLPNVEIVISTNDTTISFGLGMWIVKRDFHDGDGFTVIGRTDNVHDAITIAGS